jgi:hypothetical protein
MTHQQALDWFDHQADKLQQAGVKIRMFDALRNRAAELRAADETTREVIIAAEMIVAVICERDGEPLPN